MCNYVLVINRVGPQPMWYSETGRSFLMWNPATLILLQYGSTGVQHARAFVHRCVWSPPADMYVADVDVSLTDGGPFLSVEPKLLTLKHTHALCPFMRHPHARDENDSNSLHNIHRSPDCGVHRVGAPRALSIFVVHAIFVGVRTCVGIIAGETMHFSVV